MTAVPTAATSTAAVPTAAVTLRVPSPRWRGQALAFRSRMFAENAQIDGSAYFDTVDTFDDWLDLNADYALPETTPEGRVPATSLLITRTSDDVLVGMLSIRHALNDFLREFGGHIGYSIHPDYRRLGYASEALRQALHLCKTQLHLETALLTCAATNIASRRTILKNGGVFEGSSEHDGEMIERYWIDLGGDTNADTTTRKKHDTE